MKKTYSEPDVQLIRIGDDVIHTSGEEDYFPQWP